MRTYAELLSGDSAWPKIQAAANATERVNLLPANRDAARACLEDLQVTTRSPLGAIAHETGGVLVDSCWLRLLGSGHPRLTRTLGGWNRTLGIPYTDFLVVADDIVGGVFAINGGALHGPKGNVHYFAPDALDWENTTLGYGDFLNWAFAGDLKLFYKMSRWDGWEEDSKKVTGDRALSLYPPPWSSEGRDISKASRKSVPAMDVYELEDRVRRGITKP
jgi:hypothetical protein